MGVTEHCIYYDGFRWREESTRWLIDGFSYLVDWLIVLSEASLDLSLMIKKAFI